MKKTKDTIGKKKKKKMQPRQYSKLIRPNDVISYVKNVSLLDTKERRIHELESESELAAKKQDRIYYEKEIKKSKVGLNRLKSSVESLEDLVNNCFEEDTLEHSYNQKVFTEILDYSESRTKIHENYADEIKYYHDKIDDYERDLKSFKGVISRQIKNLYVPTTVATGVFAALKGFGVPTEMAVAGGAAALVTVRIGKSGIQLVQYLKKIEKKELKKIKAWKKEIKLLRKEEDFEKSLLYDRLTKDVTRKYISYKKDRTSAEEKKRPKRKLRKIKHDELHVYELYEIEEIEPVICEPSSILKDMDTIEKVNKIYQEEEQFVSPAQTYEQEAEKRQAFQAQQAKEFYNDEDVGYFGMD